MLLTPKKSKFTKTFSNINTKSKLGTKKTIKFGNFVLISNQIGYITNFQLENLRKTLRKIFKKSGKIFFRIFPTTPITKKPNETRLGKGKGQLKYWTCIVKKNDIIFEISSPIKRLTIQTLKTIKFHLSFKTTLFSRNKRWIL